VFSLDNASMFKLNEASQAIHFYPNRSRISFGKDFFYIGDQANVKPTSGLNL
jgi:hypothetical protein